jgi:hypothetical protein
MAFSAVELQIRKMETRPGTTECTQCFHSSIYHDIVDELLPAEDAKAEAKVEAKAEGKAEGKPAKQGACTQLNCLCGGFQRPAGAFGRPDKMRCAGCMHAEW